MTIEAVDLFCSVGRLTCGLSRAEISVLAEIDLDEACAYSYSANSAAKFLHEDVSRVPGNDLRKLYAPSDTGTLSPLHGGTNS